MKRVPIQPKIKQKQTELLTTIRAVLQRRISPKATVIVGVSGGADSMALLHLLSREAQETSRRVIAVHVNHGLRGAAAKRDERLVRQLAGQLGMTCRVYTLDVRKEARCRKLSLEEAGRILRQECFLLTARSEKAAAVLVAHHQDDQAETLLLNLLRGAAAKGLGGMPESRAFPHPGAPRGLLLIRPLLGIPKSGLTAYCQKHHLSWHTDASNRDAVFMRNRIRHRLIPFLEKQFQPNIRQVLARTAETMARDQAWLDKQTEKTLRTCLRASTLRQCRLALSTLRSMDEALRFRVFSRVWDQLGIPQKSQQHLAHLEELSSQTGTLAAFDLPGGWRARVTSRRLELYQSGRPDEKKIPGANSNVPLGVYAQPCRVPARGGVVPPGSTYVYVDAEKIHAPLQCRPRRAGDVMKPLGLQGRRKELKKILADMKIPQAQRQMWPVVVMGDEIIWVYRGPVSETVKLESNSRRALKIHLL